MAKSRLNSKVVSQILNQKKKNRKFRSFIIVLAAFVMALTSFSLSETGITMTADALNENVGKTSLLGNAFKKITNRSENTFTVSGSDAWSDLKTELEGKTSGTYNITIDGIIAADSPITLSSGVTVNLTGTNNATIYVDGGKTWTGDTSMFKVAGGTLNVENVTLSGKTATFTANPATVCTPIVVTDDRMNTYSKVSYTPSEWTTCNNVVTTNSKITADLGKNGRLSINGNVMHCVHGKEVVKDGGGIFAGSSQDQIIVARPTDSPFESYGGVSVGAGGVYYIRGGISMQEYYYLELTDSGARWRDEQAFRASTDKNPYKWTYNSDGTLRNGNKFIYFDGSQVYVTDVPTGGAGCTPEIITNSSLKIGDSVKQEVYANVSGTGANALSKTPGTNITIYNWKEEGGKAVRDTEAQSLEAGKYYFIGAGDRNLHAEGNGTKWDLAPTGGVEPTAIRKLWQYTEEGLFVNTASQEMIYFDNANELAVVSTSATRNGPEGCVAEQDTTNGTWTDGNAFDGIKDGTKGFFIHASDGATVNLKANTVIEDMRYAEKPSDTKTAKDVSPIYVTGQNTSLDINGATIRNNKGGKMPKNTRTGNDLTYLDVIEKALSESEKNDGLKSWDINPGGHNEREKQNDDTNHAAGAILIENAGVVNFESGTISGNTGVAGAVYVHGGTFNQNSGTIDGNHSYKGAVIVHGNSSTYNLNNGTLNGNDSVYLGGAITAIDEGTVNVGPNTDANCSSAMATPRITNNRTLHQGGGIYVRSNNVHLNRAVIDGNVAHMMGGGIYVFGGDANKNEANSVLVLTNTYITDNKAGNQYFKNLDKNGNDADDVIGFTATGGWHNVTNWGQGGGMWTCTYGSLIMDGNNIHMWDNEANRDGQDFYKVSKSSSHGVIVEFKQGTGDQYVYHDNHDNAFTFTQPITTSLSLDNNGNFDSAMNAAEGYCDYVKISNNTAGYAGGGIGVNGIISYKPLKEENIYVPEFSFTKKWFEADGTTPVPAVNESSRFIVKVYEKLANNTERLVTTYGDGEDPKGWIVVGKRNELSDEEQSAIDNGAVDYGFSIENDSIVHIALPQIYDENGNSRYAGINNNASATDSTNGYTINDILRIEIIEESYGTSHKYDLELGEASDFTTTVSSKPIKNYQEQTLVTYHTISLKSPDVKNIKKEIPGTKIKVNKVWDVETGEEIPDSIQVQLYRNGEPYLDPVTIDTGNELNSDNGYNTHTWEGLPKYDDDWNLYTYTVKEIPVDGFTSYISFTEGNTEYECDVNVGNITGWKEIDISELSAGRKFRMRVGDKVYYVSSNGKSQTLETRGVNSADANTENVLFEYESQRLYSKGEYTYYFLKGLKSSVVKTSFPYIKLGREDKKLHMSGIYQSIKEFGYIANNIKRMYIDAPSDGVYSWLDGDLIPSESATATNSIPQVILEVPEYSEDTSGCMAIEKPGVFTITNSDQVVELEFEKVWSDSQNKTHRPSSITVDLFRNDETEPYKTVEVTGSETDNKWYYKFTNLPKYDKDRNPITYRISERAIDYYQGSGDVSIISTNINGANGDTVESWEELTYKDLKGEQFRIVVSDKVYYIDVDSSGNKVLKTGSASDKNLYNTKSLWKVDSNYEWNNGYSTKYMTFESVEFPGTYITTEGGHYGNGANTGKLVLGDEPTTFTYDIYSKYLYWGSYYSTNSGYFTGDIDNNCSASFVKTEKANMVEKTTVTITNTYKEHEGLEIQKKNENNQNLEKAITFTIWSFDGRASLDITTDDKGHFVADNIETLFKPVFAGMINGKTHKYTGTKYVLVEKDPPEGYTILPSGVPFEIDANGRMKFLNSTDKLGDNYNSLTTTLNASGSRPAIKIDWSLIGDKNSGKDVERDKDDNRLVLNVVNRPIDNELILTKVDSSNSSEKLMNAKFSISQITSETDKTLIKKIENTARDDKLWVTDENGEWKVEDLSPGVYLITEFEAPEHYHLSNEEIIVVVDDKTGNITVKLQNNSLGTLNTTNGTTQVNFTFANNLVTYTLPETGGLGTSTCIGMGSIMIIIGALLLGKKYLSEVRG